MHAVLATATSWLRQTLRHQSRRHRIGRTPALGWVGMLLGVGITVTGFSAVNEQPLGVRSASAVTRDSTVVITAMNFEFHPATVTIRAGTTVAWDDSLGNHTIEMDDKSFISQPLIKGMRATHRFDTPGKFLYHCQLHGDFGLVGMSGTIVVTPR